MLEKFVGTIGDENAIFETILFEVESNYDYFNKNGYDVILHSLTNGKFQVEKVVNLSDPNQEPLPKSDYWKKKYWIYTVGRSQSISMVLCRIDLTIKSADIYENGNTDICHVGAMVDPDKPVKKMTPEEIRLGFQELCGILQESTETKSKPKKAM